MQLTAWLTGVMLFLVMHTALADSSLIEGSYIVTFKVPVGTEKPLIDPPDYSLKDQPGFVPTPMGYLDPLKASVIEQALGLHGKVTAIFESINAVHILMDATEAKRISLHPRVKIVEQDRKGTVALLGSGQDNSPAPENPSYRDGLLRIPRVDTPEQVGKYLDATFTLSSDGTWELNSFRELGSQSASLAPVTTVQLITVDVLPKQVFLRLSGEFNSGCGKVGQVNYRLENNAFNITLHDGFDYPKGEGCSMVIVPFQKTIALPVFGLKAGSYAYTVNGKHTGSFTLTVDNNLP